MIGRLKARWRRRRGIPPQPEYERDWAAGDLARCIVGGGPWVDAWTHEPGPGPTRGQILRVARVYPQDPTVWLVFREFGNLSFPAGHFRKLRPCERAFAEEVRRTARVPETVE